MRDRYPLLLTLQIQMQVAEEMRLKAEEEERERNRRHFESTTQTTFQQKSLQENVVGRKVMKTQDGQLVSLNNRDEQLMVEHGFVKRT